MIVGFELLSIRKRIWLLMLAALLSLLGCKPNLNNKATNPMQEYRWSITESAPKEYAVKIISGFFEAADGYTKDVPSRALVHLGWGNGRSYIASGREVMPLPKRMEITWFSYREDTFYHGSFELPFELIQKNALQKEKSAYAGLTDDSSMFTLGLAPEGFLVVWQTFNNHSRVIFSGTAEPVEGVPWSAVFDNPEFSKAEIMKNTIDETLADVKDKSQINDPTYWQRLHQELYTYDIVVESKYTPYNFSASFLDQTAHAYVSDNTQWASEPKSMLEKITFAYFFPSHFPVVPIKNINTDEMYDAFRQLSKGNEGPLRLVITIDGDPATSWDYKPRIRVENDKHSIPIHKFDFRPIDTSNFMSKVMGNKDLMRYMNYPGKPATP